MDLFQMDIDLPNGSVVSGGFGRSTMKSMKGWVTYAFNEMKLEELPYPNYRPGWAIVKTRVVQPSITEVQLFYGEHSNSYDKVKRLLGQGPQQLFGHEFCAEIVEVDSDNGYGLSVGDRVGATHTELGTIGRDFPGCFSEYAAVPLDALAKIPDGINDWEVAALQPWIGWTRNMRSESRRLLCSKPSRANT